jgi:hypothetical protein
MATKRDQSGRRVTPGASAGATQAAARSESDVRSEPGPIMAPVMDLPVRTSEWALAPARERLFQVVIIDGCC